jgi:endoglycosylceramidase
VGGAVLSSLIAARRELVSRAPVRRPAVFLAALALAACSDPAVTTPPTGTCTLEPPALASHALHADGTSIRDALDRVVVLRGVDAGGRSKFAPYLPFDVGADFDASLAAYLDRAASWGIDTLRVPFTWAAVEPTQGAYDEAYLTRYDALLDAAWARGMFTIVDFHQDIYAEALCGDGFPDWTLPEPHPAPHHDCANWGGAYLGDPAVSAGFDAFWADGSQVRARYEALWDMMAKRHAKRPGVIGFEPMNEPGWGTADMSAWEASTLPPFYAAMAARIRKAAPDALVFFDATGIDAVVLDTALTLPAAEGLVFAPHYYQTAALGDAAPDPDRVEMDLRRWANRGRTWNVPVLLGEFGVTNAHAGAEPYLRAHFDALDALGMHGTQWEYSAASELWNGEDLSVVRADGSENPMAAALVRAYPRAVAGDEVTFTFDALTGAATLRFTPSAGVSEIAAPARAYPEGYAVEVSGACTDGTHAGVLLVKADAGATSVEVRLSKR